MVVVLSGFALVLWVFVLIGVDCWDVGLIVACFLGSVLCRLSCCCELALFW